MSAELPPLPELSYLGDDVSYGYDAHDMQDYARAYAAAAVAAEREAHKRVAEAAQAVTMGGKDEIDYFSVPAHLMAALALALDEAIRGQDQKEQA